MFPVTNVPTPREGENMEPGTLHVISEIGGCIVGLPPDEKGITDSLRNYARREGLESLELVDPASQDLCSWEEMVKVAVKEYRVEGTVLVGTHDGDRSLVGVSKRYGLPVPGASLEDIVTVVRLPA